jgi:hypothetical protein
MMSRNSFQNDRGVWSGWIGLQSITRAHDLAAEGSLGGGVRPGD